MDDDGPFAEELPEGIASGDWIETAAQHKANLRKHLRPILHDTADVAALPPETVFRTANGGVGRIFDTGITHVAQWVGTDYSDDILSEYAIPLPDMMFPAEVIWSREK